MSGWTDLLQALAIGMLATSGVLNVLWQRDMRERAARMEARLKALEEEP